MVVIEVIFIILLGAFMLVPLFARDADVQDHLDSLDAVCRHGVESRRICSRCATGDRNGHVEAESDE